MALLLPQSSLLGSNKAVKRIIKRTEGIPMRLIMGALLSAVLTGCAATGTYTPPSSNRTESFSAVVDQDYDATWRAIIDHVSSTFFAIENFEKDSGLITVSFGTANPGDFIDCGEWTAKWTDANYRQHTFDGSYVEFMRLYHAAQLTGSMNISARRQAANQTEVRVNARYIFAAPPNVWSFDSGSSATVSPSNSMPGIRATRTCRPTYKAETSILSSIEAVAQ